MDRVYQHRLSDQAEDMYVGCSRKPSRSAQREVAEDTDGLGRLRSWQTAKQSTVSVLLRCSDVENLSATKAEFYDQPNPIFQYRSLKFQLYFTTTMRF